MAKFDEKTIKSRLTKELFAIATANGVSYCEKAIAKKGAQGDVQLYDKFKAIEMLGRSVGLFERDGVSDVNAGTTAQVVIVDNMVVT